MSNKSKNKNNRKINFNSNKTQKKDNLEAYELHTDAVERLVSANVENSQDVSEKELKQYKRDKLSSIPTWIKALFIKFWFNGAVCYFFFWGISLFDRGIYDQIFVVGIGMGIVTNLLVNNIFRFFDSGDGAYTKWMMFSSKKFWFFFVDIIYAFVILFFVVIFYNGTNILINNLSGAGEENITLGVEPFLFGLLYLLVDLAFLGIRALIKRMIRDANIKLNSEKRNKQ